MRRTPFNQGFHYSYKLISILGALKNCLLKTFSFIAAQLLFLQFFSFSPCKISFIFILFLIPLYFIHLEANDNYIDKYSTSQSNILGFKEHLAFTEQSKIPVFFFFDSLKTPCIKQTNLRPVLGFNELQVLANPP